MKKKILIILVIVLALTGGFFIIRDIINDKNEQALLEKVKENLAVYSSSSVTINNINDAEFLGYVVDMAAIHYDINKNGEGTLCSDKDCTQAKLHNLSKEKIDEYIKETFNTSKIFSVPEKTVKMMYNPLTNDLGEYIYKNKTYYFSYLPRNGKVKETKYSVIEKVEEDNDKIYVYEKVIFCYSATNDKNKTNTICYNNLESKSEKNIVINITDKNINGKNIFRKYSDKIKTYKNTYKKVDDKYYWYSSEIQK